MHHLFIAAATEAQHQPSSEVLFCAPVLRDWIAMLDAPGVLCLGGTVTGHPLLEDGMRIYTSMLITLDPGGAWARTRSRWYRLAGEWSANATPREVIIRNCVWLCPEDARRAAASLQTAILQHRGRPFDA